MACAIQPNKDQTNAMTKPVEQQPKPKPMLRKDSDTHQASCIVCWESTINKPTTTLSCHHGACTACIQSWIERCETNGQDEATCPHCRCTIDSDIIRDVLGRPYHRKSQLVDAQAPVDDFTQTWFQDNDAHQCNNCGLWAIQEDDEDEDEDDRVEAAACYCGYIFCWKCMEGVHDGCNCNHYKYYEQLTDTVLLLESASDFPVAGPELFDDLSDFMETRREAIDACIAANRKRPQTPAPAQTTVIEVTEQVDVYIVALFEEYTEDMDVFLVPLFEEYTEDSEQTMTGIFDGEISHVVVA